MYRKTNIAHALSLLGLLSVAGQGLAQEEGLFFDAVPIVYSASRMPQHQSETPNFVTVIDRDMIRASGAREVSDLLRLVPGFQVTSRVLEVPARVAYHGLATEDYSPRMQVLIDGRSQYSALFKGGVNWDLLPVAIEDIERIEVVRGTNVAAYGTNAFMGVVNIITVDPTQVRGTTLAANAGSRGVSDQFARFAGKVGDASMRISYQGQADEGIKFVPQDVNNPPNIANGQRKRLFDLRSDFTLGQRDTLSLNLGKVEGNMQVGRPDATETDPFTQTVKMTNPPRTIYQSSQFAQLGWQRLLENGNELLLRIHGTEDKFSDPPIFSDSVFALDQGGTSARYEVEFQHTLNLDPAFRFLWGAGARHEQIAKSYQYYRGDAERRVNRLFAHAEWRPTSSWMFNVGASSDRDSYAGEQLSPRLSTSYQLADGHTLRAGASQSYRIPSFNELVGYVNYVPVGWPSGLTEYIADGRVRSEKLISREVGYFGEFRSWHATLDVRAFSEYIPNRIQRVQALGQTYDYAVNAERVQVDGVEYQARWQPWEGTRLMWSQAATQIRSELLDFPTAWGDSLQERMQRQTRNSAPSLTNSAMLMQKLPQDFDFSVLMYQVDTMYWAPSKPAGAYTRVDWRLAKRFTVGTTRAEVAYVVQSEEGAHAELKPSNLTVPKQWVSLRIEL